MIGDVWKTQIPVECLFSYEQPSFGDIPFFLNQGKGFATQARGLTEVVFPISPRATSKRRRGVA